MNSSLSQKLNCKGSNLSLWVERCLQHMTEEPEKSCKNKTWKLFYPSSSNSFFGLLRLRHEIGFLLEFLWLRGAMLPNSAMQITLILWDKGDFNGSSRLLRNKKSSFLHKKNYFYIFDQGKILRSTWLSHVPINILFSHSLC